MKKKLTLLFALLCVSMMGFAEPVTYTGAGFSGAINSYTYDIGYSITYDDDHHLTFNVTLDGTFQETDGFVFEVWSTDLSTGNFKSLVHGEGNAWSVTDEKDYQSMEGQSLNQLRLRLASSQGGTDQLYLSDYTVGLSGSAAVSGPTTRANTPSAPSNKVKAIYSWYYAKGCNFADWGGGTSSQNMRFGKKLSCNRAEGNGWLGLVDFGDLDCSGMEKLHMDIWVEDNASMRLTPIHYAYGDEYRHAITLTGGQWNSIELDLNSETFVSDASVGAPNDYWDVINQFKIDLLANGLDFWIDNVYFYSDQSPVFTSISITGPTICKVGQNIPLTIETLDQFGQHIDAEFTCSVSPVSAGTVVGTTYTPSAKGAATITVTSGLISNTLTVFNYEGSNLALNHLVSQSTEFSGYGAARALDGDNGTEWQGSPTNGTAADESSRTYDCWFTADLSGGNGDKYDVDLVTIKFEGACSDAYHIDFSADGVSWETGYNFAQVMGVNGHTDYITSFTNNSGVQYVRFWSTKASTQYGMKIFEFQVFGSEAASPTKSVSAAVNDPAMGTATVKQNDEDVTEVATGSTVTFSATPNDGYIFVNWSNGNTNATFNATVDAAMNLTANFRALGNIYCNTLVHSSNGGQEHDAYVTMKRSGENEYQLIVRAEYALGNFSNTEFRIKALDAENPSNYNLNNKGVLSADNHTLTGTIISTIEPEMISGRLYVNIVGQWEGQFDRLTNIEYSQPCADPEITAITLDKTEATLDMGNTLTLVPTFTPSYMSADITWQTSSDAVATVSNGVVTPVAPGSATITAKVTESIKATCSVTVQTAASHNWYGYGTSEDLDYTYRIEYTTDHHIVAHVKRQGEKTGLVNVGMNISNVWTDINVTEGEEEGWKKGTTAATFTAGDNIHILFQSNWAGPSSIVEFDYEVGADNVMPTIVPSVLKLNTNEITMGVYDADIQLTTEIHHRDAANQNITWTSDDESVATVENGMVHPVGVGSTIIHASTFNGVSESCDVTVVGELEPATFWGNGTSNGVAIAYSITRNSNHTLTYAVEALQDKEGFVVRINDGGYHDATFNEGIYTWTSEATYIDGAVFSGFIYMPFTGGDARVDFVNYVVGSESARRNIPITVNESLDNSSVLATSDGIMRDVTVSRSFSAGNLYTLVLPFDVDAAQTAAKLPGHLTKLQNTIVKENQDLRINFVDVSEIEAGVPYLYEPNAAVANPTFESVEVSATLHPTMPADGYAKYYGIYAPMDGDALHDIANAYVLGPDQYLYAVSDLPANQTMLALRGYFVLSFPPSAGAAPRRVAQVVFNSQETDVATGIENAIDNEQNAKILRDGQLLIIREGKMYNAQGQLIK